MLTYLLDYQAKKKGRLVDIRATVLKETAKSFEEICEITGLTIGQVIDRLTLKMVPHEPNFAAQLVQEEMLMCLSGLNEEQYTEAFTEILVVLLAAIPADGLPVLGAKAKEKRHTLLGEVADAIDGKEESRNFSEAIDRLVKEIESHRASER